MATKLYQLTKGDSKRLALRWGMGYSNLTVRLDGQVIGTIPNKAALEAGQNIHLGTDSDLYIYLERSQLHVNYNGKPLPGSPGDPQYKLNQAVGVLIWVSISTILFAMVGGTASYSQTRTLSLWITIGIGVVYGLLAFFVRSRSKIALGIAVFFYGLDTLGVIFLLLGRSPGIYIVSFFVHLLFLRLMWRGFSAIDDLASGNYNMNRSGPGILQPLPGRFPNDINSGAETMVIPSSAPIAPQPSAWMQPATPISEIMKTDAGTNLTPVTKSSADQLLRQAVDIVKSGGDRQQAKSLVNEALKIESHNADCWYLIGYLADTKAERKAALERTLALNPNHQRAQQEFARLTNG
jgi:hypothetical protein